MEIIVITDSSDDGEDLRPSRTIPLATPALDRDLTTESVRAIYDDDDSSSDEDGSPVPTPKMRKRKSRNDNHVEEAPASECGSEEPTPSEFDSQNTSDDQQPKESLSQKARRRETFRKILRRMETPADIQRLYPQSLHPGFGYDEAITDEAQVLGDFVAHATGFDAEEDTFEELDIQDFSLYRGILQQGSFQGQLESAHIIVMQAPTLFEGLAKRFGFDKHFHSSRAAALLDGHIFAIDGLICHDGETRRIIGGSITEVSIGGLLDTQLHTTMNQIWVRTGMSRCYNGCWLRLRMPSPEYSDTWQAFLWLADLCKHVIDYLYYAGSAKEISLSHFECDFYDKLTSWHGNDEDFAQWSKQYASKDFRQHVATHAELLRYQSCTIDSKASIALVRQHPLWDEIGAGDIEDSSRNASERTVVTPHTGATFLKAFPKWGPSHLDLLEIVPMSAAVRRQREIQREKFGFPHKLASNLETQFETHAGSKRPVSKLALLLERATTINRSTSLSAAELLGKVVVIRQRANHQESRFSNDDEDYRFAFVKAAARLGNRLRVVWLVLPSQTICGSEHDRTHYPVGNELFFTDECNCKPVPLSRVVAVINASVMGADSPSAEATIQMLYAEDEETFTTPIDSELLCDCQSPNKYATASTPDPVVQKVDLALLPKILNFSLFSGAGLFDEGLRDSEVFETIFAIDNYEMAMNSFRANSKSKRCTHITCSVNVYLRQILRGKKPIPHIHCITAGCPCQGFSRANNHKAGPESQRKCSMLALTLSWVEMLLPPLVLIENVTTMYSSPGDQDLANAGAQAVCCLVALGYQVRQMQLCAAEYGAPTIRKRTFLVAAAPRLKLPAVPLATHGKAAGLKPFVTATDVLHDLSPVLNDDSINVQHPLHIPIRRLNTYLSHGVSVRDIVSRIPKERRAGVYQAWQRGLLTRSQNDYLESYRPSSLNHGSHSLRRIDPGSPFNSILKVIVEFCNRMGHVIHPTQDRLISVEEAKRAQGFRDFILVGSIMKQAGQVGNGVPRQLAAAVGGSFREAWIASLSCGALGKLEKSAEAYHTKLLLPVESPADALEGDSEELTSSQAEAALATPRSDQQQLERDLNEVLRRTERLDTDGLPDDDTFEVRTPDPNLSLAALARAQGFRSTSSEPKKQSVSPTGTDDVDTEDSEAPVPLRRNRQGISSPEMEETFDILDRESLAIEQDGSARYNYSRRARLSRRLSGASQTAKKVVPVVEIPVKRRGKRAASPTPPPAYSPRTNGNPVQDDSGSDVVFVKSIPVAKKRRYN